LALLEIRELEKTENQDETQRDTEVVSEIKSEGKHNSSSNGRPKLKPDQQEEEEEDLLAIFTKEEASKEYESNLEILKLLKPSEDELDVFALPALE